MENVLIKYLAFPAATKEVYKRGEEIIKKNLPDFNFQNSEISPEILFILTGGSENQAKKIIDNSSCILLLAMNENNSYAAATEIKAYCNQKNILSILLNLDTEKDILSKIEFYLQFKKAITNLRNCKLGLVGNVSEWLIASDVHDEVLKNKLGIQLKRIDWKNYKLYSEFDVNPDFISHFKNTGKFDLSDSSKVYNLLLNIIKENKLDAITVECFPLVREHSVTACLALSKLNTDNLPAGCEGDLTSIIGMIIAKELTGQIPWMANLVSLNTYSAFFAHCTIATNLVSEYKIDTHFETNTGTAVQGEFNANAVTIFRLDKNIEQAFISCGEIVSKPNKDDACRTQIEVKLTKGDIGLLKNNPLGNHHLILPGDYKEIFEFFCKMLKIKILE
ncbi:MAG: hypothetical protein A2X13_12350 [Bacteroidetes bacterium GWC2_33_15]|nr:MAG: hypothetical protein A2X10_14345 [Bacteroidetes bacterium GWA2_33_15]OFX50582.1 MAG: hypothetical protein A2X13_12350 [Bacteroidetes bacterium GWC2_33_15]OFX64119.1 MAG: hypothetical protein A2X15_02800 [Bacteroidetes bacterium GWB2_32_14]OFX69731.1 MAG: hypothetical protein A2X14_05025 [Bacteroidetes bacterium GWD2_33_33]HAN19767.1 hypothetical protein [Bacteroidales bacterium]